MITLHLLTYWKKIPCAISVYHIIRTWDYPSCSDTMRTSLPFSSSSWPFALHSFICWLKTRHPYYHVAILCLKWMPSEGLLGRVSFYFPEVMERVFENWYLICLLLILVFDCSHVPVCLGFDQRQKRVQREHREICSRRMCFPLDT